MKDDKNEKKSYLPKQNDYCYIQMFTLIISLNWWASNN